MLVTFLAGPVIAFVITAVYPVIPLRKSHRVGSLLLWRW